MYVENWGHLGLAVSDLQSLSKMETLASGIEAIMTGLSLARETEKSSTHSTISSSKISTSTHTLELIA